jgi:hypothetical protein
LNTSAARQCRLRMHCNWQFQPEFLLRLAGTSTRDPPLAPIARRLATIAQRDDRHHIAGILDCLEFMQHQKPDTIRYEMVR